MKLIALLSSIMVFSCSAQTDSLEWADFVPVSSKEVKSKMMGITIDWPIFDKDIVAKNGTVIEIEGYYLRDQSIDLENQTQSIGEDGQPELNYTTVNLLLCCNEPTIEICGVPRYQDYEYLIFDFPKDTQPIQNGKKIRVAGKLKLNQDGASGSLIQLTNVTITESS